MALLKCKMCNAQLNFSAGDTVVECEYCGTKQTLPKTTDENVQNLFNRANLLRHKNEFDKDLADKKAKFPVFVKPVRGSASVAISKVNVSI